ncbi:hypothetical protein NDR87_11270 [Nocardia sp. CDC159]|uniref:Uncharacterized protein n=1 Tax=Nocardia pulmonis TaxID=2951408 RepID=A0A9X2IVM7_9NOCA|nr:MULTISPECIES: hypothetical protein [Nocardia]MCM6774052.1 hypothetical protein [Nocardia pulmonis]MCM6786939.1 hypothetical protein [Nocardia sp. CDC159]
MHTDIDWTIPPTPPGWRGRLLRFLGPGKTRAEETVELVGGALGVAVIAWYLWHFDAAAQWPAWKLALIGVLAVDLVGGVLTNATNAAKRWYHRDAPGIVRKRRTFVALHLAHLAAVAFVLLPAAWDWFAVNAVLLLAAAALIERVPLGVKRPTAMAAWLTVVTITPIVYALPTALAWFTPIFYLKLLISHLIPEAPMQQRHA